tara:strand:+ start:424 stop:678 length:255 start_codon:yes stop_codon:yes gene_type:complete
MEEKRMAPVDRKVFLEALRGHAKGQIAKHKANVEIFMSNAVGVGEHTDIIESVAKELDSIAKYDDQLNIVNKYFDKDPLKPNTD